MQSTTKQLCFWSARVTIAVLLYHLENRYQQNTTGTGKHDADVLQWLPFTVQYSLQQTTVRLQSSGVSNT